MNSNKESYRELVSIRRYRVGDYPLVISSHMRPSPCRYPPEELLHQQRGTGALLLVVGH